MRQVNLNELNEEIAFAEKAAKHFAEHKEHVTFAEDDLKPGCFLAMRWGMGEDCVVVLKLDEFHEPKNYAQLIRKYETT